MLEYFHQGQISLRALLIYHRLGLAQRPTFDFYQHKNLKTPLFRKFCQHLGNSIRVIYLERALRIGKIRPETAARKSCRYWIC